MNLQPSFSSRRDFLRACLLAGAALTVPRWVLGTLVSPAPVVAPLLFPDLNIYPRSTWSALAPRLSLIRPATGFSRLTIHHAGNIMNTHVQPEDVVADLNGILAAHLQKNYGDIGYHFIVDYAGRIWEGRSLAFEGAHVSGMNKQNMGVMLLGNFEEQQPSADQIDSLFQLVDSLQRQYALPHGSIYGHCDLGQSVCPGKHLYAPFVAELKQS
ncbi:MAG: peptidoglycan recognition protein family protein [Verrucomicrobia bacterium]|nr:peptidoglycan recognition protein family protein [Verrucomicrobiota bacterium]MCG2678369.1 peptidoglycan recognition protein family protein [Kiritimatiellia bacterium]MBU4247350.1 peptidoglycan recognition protein family protein [Verrucomicrobiota bacterium]MBU4291475.1 peptidoglycan recognition protein family protein [Verrucomicrobiota bacterium]MBU4428739.1 peptidoglycan recognition protein family protein [Verrucomicrobiota bacterium]